MEENGGTSADCGRGRKRKRSVKNWKQTKLRDDR